MKSPYEFMPLRSQLIAWLIFTALTSVTFWYLNRQGNPLKNILNQGILGLELVWSTANAQESLETLDLAGAREVARTNVLYDFVFLMFYPLSISLACALLASFVGEKEQVYGNVLAWAVLAAIPLDAIENAALLLILSDHTAAPWPQLATICAVMKFGVVAGGIGILFPLIWFVVRRAG